MTRKFLPFLSRVLLALSLLALISFVTPEVVRADFISLKLPPLALEAKTAVVIEASSGKILFGKNPAKRIYPASLTKLMTLYIIFDQLKKHNITLDQKVRVGAHAYKVGNSTTGSSTMFLLPNQEVTVENLIHGIATVSGNDASVAMAEFIAGTESQFASYMNLYAAKLGLNQTHFVNATGWPNVNHYSTALDIANLSRHIMIDFPEYYHFLSVKSFTFNKITQNNRNTLLFDNSLNVDGLKTGHTTQAGFSLAFSARGHAKNSNLRIIGVIDGLKSATQRISQSKKLINWILFNLNCQTLYPKGAVVKKVPVWQGSVSSLPLITHAPVNLFYSKLLTDGANTYQVTIEYPNVITGRIKTGAQIGKIVMTNPSNPDDHYSYNLYAGTNVEPASRLSNFLKAPYWFIRKLFI